MELNLIRETLGKAKGVEGYCVLDVNGAVLTQDLGTYANRIKRTEFATWVLNCFYAIDTYYPQAHCVLLRYDSGRLYLTRIQDRLITVMCRHGADIHFLENTFGKHRQSMAKSNSSGIVREKSKKGETVFLKISETGSGATGSPIPKKKSSSPVPLLIGALVVIGAIVGVVAFTMSSSKGEAEPATVATAQPANSTASAGDTATDPKANATSARDRANALATVARQEEAANHAAMDMARAVANNESAQQKFAAGDYVAAASLWKDAAESYGKASVTAAEKKFNLALQTASLGVVANYPNPEWIAMENAMKQAREDAANGNYTGAIQTIKAQQTKIPALRKVALEQLSALAAKNAADTNIPTAIELYESVLAIDPSNETAKSFIFEHRYKPGETSTNSVGMIFAFIPPGKFTRGSPENEAYRDADEVQAVITLTEGYFIATTEVTQQQWEDVMGQRMRMDDADSEFIGRQLPVHSITWEQAQEFCRRLSELEGKIYRLPTEAEWEYAARAGTTTPYNTNSERLTSRDANIYDPSGEGLDTIAAVGSIGSANAWGLYDMHGNVWEWTADWSAPYVPGPQTNPTGPDESQNRVDLAMKIIRGGSFIDDAHFARSANRSEASPVVANSYTGFRPVLVIADL
ncbi:MAG: SUMF1/EgtB/PvdO family nonheme iron enzyme [Puniceicoccales bacterium]